MIRKIYHQTIAITTLISPSLASRILYRINMGRWPNLREPQLFSEKLMKLKLDNYLTNPTIWRCCDKLAVRDYITDRGISQAHLPTLLATYTDADDIDFDVLPNKFVLKSSHGSGFNLICTDKSSLNYDQTRDTLAKWLRSRFGLSTAETQYGHVPPSIICEEFIEGQDGGFPNDYKVYCFDGTPQYIMACTDRQDGVKSIIYDLDWLDTGYLKPEYASSKKIAKPKTYQKMLDMSRLISSEFPFVRVDFYEYRDTPIVGELTFTPHACMNNNMTDEGQRQLGEILQV